MVMFKIVFPAGYIVDDVVNDNLDIRIITDDGNVYFATVFTPQNVVALMLKDGGCHFWATDMVIVIDLEKQTIRRAIGEMIDEGYLEEALTNIGTLEEQYPGKSFDQIEDFYDPFKKFRDGH